MQQQVRASFTCFIILFFLLIATTFLVPVHSSNTEIYTSKVINENQAQELQHRWQRKTWMNHGSHRGHRKHLVNLTAKNPFQALEFPV
ncbi:hypothetical protein Lal_00007250 [Lupinus albus]|uniref:Uncharacterized protein n=1 Tax=Lupinus albus TaxID=3870 RepID=A0A6A5MK42_LUPAL|nr:hypothetical protein Lalb_Chr16g0380951 [Lupinus albus]KAF1874636.1 hypothetical protein Lal_00007250 [Lupinus albus]